MKQIDYESDLTLKQSMFDCSEVFRKSNFSGGNEGVYDLPNESSQNSCVNVSHHSDLLLKSSTSNVGFCQSKYNYILNVDAPVFHMYLNGGNEFQYEYNVYARVFTPASFDLVCNQKYVNNAGYVINYSLTRRLCREKSTNTLSDMQGVSLISSHSTVHLDVVYGLDNLHTSCSSSKSASTLISIHENLYPTFFESSNFSNTFNGLISEIFSYVQHTL